MDGPAQQFLEHPRRTWFVWGAVCLVGLALTLPAWESFAAANDGRATLETELAATRAAAASLPALKARIIALRAAGASIDGSRGLNETTAEGLREEVERQITAAGCRLRRLTLDLPVTTPWADGPPPLPGLAAAVTGRGSAPSANGPSAGTFDLVTQRLEAEAVGSAEQIAGLLDWAATAHPHAVALEYTLKFEEAPGPASRSVHLTFSLLLTSVHPHQKPAAK